MESESGALDRDDLVLLDYLEEQQAEQPLEDRVDQLQRTVRNLRNQLHEQLEETEELRSVLQDVIAWKERVDLEELPTPEPIAGTTLERFAAIPADERKDILSASDHLAATIQEHWEDLAWAMGDRNQRRYGVDTKTSANAKHAPSRLKHRLNKILDREIEWMQIYRAMQQVAKLSGGVERVDQETSRVQISGGLYEYRETTTVDNSDTKRVLWRRSE